MYHVKVGFVRACLYDETVVAEPNGTIEDSGDGGSGKVAQSEGWGEKTGHKALHLGQTKHDGMEKNQRSIKTFPNCKNW